MKCDMLIIEFAIYIQIGSSGSISLVLGSVIVYENGEFVSLNPHVEHRDMLKLIFQANAKDGLFLSICLCQ